MQVTVGREQKPIQIPIWAVVATPLALVAIVVIATMFMSGIFSSSAPASASHEVVVEGQAPAPQNPPVERPEQYQAPAENKYAPQASSQTPMDQQAILIRSLFHASQPEGDLTYSSGHSDYQIPRVTQYMVSPYASTTIADIRQRLGLSPEEATDFYRAMSVLLLAQHGSKVFIQGFGSDAPVIEDSEKVKAHYDGVGRQGVYPVKYYSLAAPIQRRGDVTLHHYGTAGSGGSPVYTGTFRTIFDKDIPVSIEQ